MFRSLHVAATGMVAQETQLDTIANNLANANTTGYKKQSAEFEDLLYQNVRSPVMQADGTISATGTQVGSGARVVSTARSFSQGTIQQTGNTFDVAIEGQGFLGVMQPTGEVAYSRAGSLQVDAQGRLSTGDGLPVEPPITIPADATSVTIAADGTVSAVTSSSKGAPAVLGQLNLTNFQNPNGLNAIGHNLFTQSGASGEPQTGLAGADGRGTFMQGALEGSNVEVVTEMVSMISTQRAYEINSKVIQAADEMLKNATEMQ
jgi:flagellar basal-body rod protein FlgG